MRSMFRSILLIGILSGYCGNAMAQAGPVAAQGSDCQLQINTSQQSWILRGVDPLSVSQQVGRFDVQFVNNGDRPCRFTPVFKTDQSAFGLRTQGGNASVAYALVNETDGYNATPVGSTTPARVMEVQPRATRLVSYSLTVDPAQLPGDGLFSQALLLQADAVVGGGILAQRQMQVGVDVAPSAVMSLAGAVTSTNGVSDVDLGELTGGTDSTQRAINTPLVLNVVSTRAFQLRVESQNGGKLQLEGSNWAISYQMLIDGKPAVLNALLPYGTNGPIGLRTTTLPLGFSIGDTKGKRAGRYTDVVKISVSVD